MSMSSGRKQLVFEKYGHIVRNVESLMALLREADEALDGSVVVYSGTGDDGFFDGGVGESCDDICMGR